MRYRLRTLLVVLALGPPIIAAGWWGYGKWRAERREPDLDLDFSQEVGGSVSSDIPLLPPFQPPPDENRSPLPVD